MKHESCQNSVKSMKHCGLPPHPPLQINKKIRKGSKQNHTHDQYQSQRDNEQQTSLCKVSVEKNSLVL